MSGAISGRGTYVDFFSGVTVGGMQCGGREREVKLKVEDAKDMCMYV